MRRQEIMNVTYPGPADVTWLVSSQARNSATVLFFPRGCINTVLATKVIFFSNVHSLVKIVSDTDHIRHTVYQQRKVVLVLRFPLNKIPKYAKFHTDQ